MLSVCRLSVCLSSAKTLVHPTQPVEIFGNFSTSLVPWPSTEIHGKSYGNRPNGDRPRVKGNLSVEGGGKCKKGNQI